MTVPALRADWDNFLRHKIEVGEIYSHLKTLTGAVEDESPQEKLFAYGLFVAYYSPGPAYIHLKNAPRPCTLEWLEENWEILHPEAKERFMVVGSPERMLPCIHSIEEWALNTATVMRMLHASTYEQVFKDCSTPYKIGRYMAIRLANACWWGLAGKQDIPTIHARNGKAIREPLHMVTERLPNWRDESSWEQAERVGQTEQLRLKFRGIDLDLSEISEMLCDFKRMVRGKHYTGIQLADRLPAIKRAKDAGYDVEALLRSRRRQFNSEYLTERWGVWQPDDNLKTFYQQHGMEWKR